jgi:hypothetical protein
VRPPLAAIWISALRARDFRFPLTQFIDCEKRRGGGCVCVCMAALLGFVWLASPLVGSDTRDG